MFKYNADSKFAAFIGRLADVFFLNLLWLAFSLPLVTIGASTVAAFGVCLKLAEGEDPPLARSFLKAFRESLGQGSLLWLLSAAAIYALYIDWQLALGPDDPPVLLIIASLVTTVLAFCALVYAYPISARYRNGLRKNLANSVRLCFRFPGRTFLLLLLLVFEAAIFSWNETMILFGIAVGPMILIYTVGLTARRIFADIERAGGTAAEPCPADHCWSTTVAVRKA